MISTTFLITSQSIKRSFSMKQCNHWTSKYVEGASRSREKSKSNAHFWRHACVYFDSIQLKYIIFFSFIRVPIITNEQKINFGQKPPKSYSKCLRNEFVVHGHEQRMCALWTNSIYFLMKNKIMRRFRHKTTFSCKSFILRSKIERKKNIQSIWLFIFLLNLYGIFSCYCTYILIFGARQKTSVTQLNSK